MKKYQMSRQILHVCAVFLAVVASAWLYLSSAHAQSDNQCCNGVDANICSGCFWSSAAGCYIPLGSNPVYYCKTYSNPVGCRMQYLPCYNNAGPVVQGYSDSTCSTPSTKLGSFTLGAYQCSPDSCD